MILSNTSDTDALGQIVPYRASNVLKQWYKCFNTSDTDALGQIVPYRVQIVPVRQYLSCGIKSLARQILTHQDKLYPIVLLTRESTGKECSTR